ncbi:MAG: acyltransferase family protein [Lachnospiraceae bacterium]|nr:acyltransferase family protein [Lachnospiraceae bacterium]
MTAKSGDGMRNSYMDFLKGIAIISVIAGHSLSDIRGMDILFNLIYSFHMPLLFFVSAYIEEQNRAKYAEKEGQMLFRRMSGLLLPYLSWTVIYAAIDGHLWEAGAVGFISDLLGYRSNGLWFFPVLFGLKVMHVLYWIIRRKTGRDTFVTDLLLLGGLEIVIVLLAVLTRQPYIVNMLSYAIPYFFAVILVKHEVIQKLVNSEWITAGAILVYALVFPFFSFYNTHWTTQVLRIGLALCVIVICCRFNDDKGRWRTNRFYPAICVCGQNSLAVYVLHGFLMDYKDYFNMIDSVVIVGIVSVSLALLVAAVCITVAKVIGISPWCRKILFGK